MRPRPRRNWISPGTCCSRAIPWRGSLTLAPDRDTYLLLVDHDGIAHNLDGILKRSGDTASFSVQLGLGAGEGVGKSPLPQMLVAFSSSSPVAAMQITKPVPAGELFPPSRASCATAASMPPPPPATSASGV